MGNIMSLVKRSTSLLPYRSMTQLGMAIRARGETWSPRAGARPLAQRSARLDAAPHDSMAGAAGPSRAGPSHGIATGIRVGIAPAHRIPRTSALSPRGPRSQWAPAFLAALPMVPRGVAARWRRAASEPGKGSEAVTGGESHAALLSPTGEWGLSVSRGC